MMHSDRQQATCQAARSTPHLAAGRGLARCARAVSIWLISQLAGLAACSPTYDWRQVSADAALVAMFPCKPHEYQRKLRLAGRPVTMRMLACEAGGSIWGLTMADLAGGAAPGAAAAAPNRSDHGAVDAALSALNAGLAGNAAGAARPLGRSAVPGADLYAHGLRIHVDGRRPDGSLAYVEAWTFAQGTRIYQASAVSTAATPALNEVQEQFFSALKLSPS